MREVRERHCLISSLVRFLSARKILSTKVFEFLIFGIWPVLAVNIQHYQKGNFRFHKFHSLE